MKVKVSKVGVTFESGVLEVGTIMEVPDKDGERLVASGYAVAVEPEEEPEAPADEQPEQEAPKKSSRGKKTED